MIHTSGRDLAKLTRLQRKHVMTLMSDEPDNMVLAHLRAIRADVQNIGRDVAEVKTRVGRLEIGLAQTNTMIARAQVAIAERSARIDAMDDRLKRIERRLELVGEPTLTPTP